MPATPFRRVSLPLAFALPLFALACTLCGCGHYTLGSPAPAAYRAVSVPVFANDTEHAEVGHVVTKAIRTRMIQDGTFAIVSEKDAGLRIKGVVSDYSGASVRYDRNRNTSADEYRMALTVTIDLVDAAGRVVLGGQRIRGSTTFVTRGDYLTAMQDAFPRAADDIARQVIDLIEGLKAPTEKAD